MRLACAVPQEKKQTVIRRTRRGDIKLLVPIEIAYRNRSHPAAQAKTIHSGVESSRSVSDQETDLLASENGQVHYPVIIEVPASNGGRVRTGIGDSDGTAGGGRKASLSVAEHYRNGLRVKVNSRKIRFTIPIEIADGDGFRARTGVRRDLTEEGQSARGHSHNMANQDNKALVLMAFDTLFNQRDYAAAIE